MASTYQNTTTLSATPISRFHRLQKLSFFVCVLLILLFQIPTVANAQFPIGNPDNTRQHLNIDFGETTDGQEITAQLEYKQPRARENGCGALRWNANLNIFFDGELVGVIVFPDAQVVNCVGSLFIDYTGENGDFGQGRVDLGDQEGDFDFQMNGISGSGTVTSIGDGWPNA